MSASHLPNRGHIIWGAIAALLVALLGATAAIAQEEFVPTAFEVIPVQAGEVPIVVGTAEPGAIVELLDGNTVVVRSEANALGEWIALPEGLEAGTYRLTVRTTSADGRFQVVSEERVALAIEAASANAHVEPPIIADPQEPRRFTIADFDVTIAVDAGTGAAGEGALSSPRTIVVRSGDTLWEIAERIYGDGTLYRRILDANRATIPGIRSLQPGQVLIVPPLVGR